MSLAVSATQNQVGMDSPHVDRTPVIAALGPQNEDDAATAACVVFDDWSSSEPLASAMTIVIEVAPGGHLYEALGHSLGVVGVAKSPYHNSIAISVLCGEGERPLYVTAAGTAAEEAAKLVQSMHQPYRVQTMLKYVDSLARGTTT